MAHLEDPRNMEAVATSQPRNSPLGEASALSLKRKQSHDSPNRSCKMSRVAARHCCSRKSPVTSNYMNFLKSGLPRRVLFYSSGEWTDFPQNVTTSLIEGFHSKKSAVPLSMSDIPYLFDFVSMVLINLKSGDQQSIAWIDEDDKCFFPAIFVEEESSVIDETDDSYLEASASGTYGDHNVGKCNQAIPSQPEMLKEVIAENVIPSVEMQAPAMKSLQPGLVRLERGSKMFLSVMGTFLKGMGTFAEPSSIVSIHCFSPKTLTRRSRLEIFEQQIKTVTAQHRDANVRNGWFGTSKDDLFKILSQGFYKGARLSEGASYGTGVYLAPENRAFSCANHCDVDENGLQYMLLCRVIMGNMEQVPEGSRQCLPSKPDYDCGVDDPSRPKRYVVWGTHLNSHIHPDYVVCFRLSPAVRGYFSEMTDMGRTSLVMAESQKNAATDHPVACGPTAGVAPTTPWISFTTLFSAIGNDIPPIAKELLNLHYQEFKHCVITREMLVRNMRVIVGDRLLLSALGKLQKNP